MNMTTLLVLVLISFSCFADSEFTVPGWVRAILDKPGRLEATHFTHGGGNYYSHLEGTQLGHCDFLSSDSMILLAVHHIPEKGNDVQPRVTELQVTTSEKDFARGVKVGKVNLREINTSGKRVFEITNLIRTKDFADWEGDQSECTVHTLSISNDRITVMTNTETSCFTNKEESHYSWLNYTCTRVH